MYYIKWGGLYVHMVSNYVRVDKSPLITHTDIEDARDEAGAVAKFLGVDIEVYKVELVYREEA